VRQLAALNAMSAKAGSGSKKHGRNARRPALARRKGRRPDLRRKARNVRRGGGNVRAWAEAAIRRGESAGLVYSIRDAELRRAGHLWTVA